MKQIILSLLVIPMFFSCQKDNDQAPENNDPVFISEYENAYGTFKLSYDSKDRLSKVVHWTDNGYTPALFISRIVEYNYSEDKVVGYTTQYGGENTPPGAPRTTTFVFDNKGHITQSVTDNVKSADWKTDADGRPVTRIISNGPSPEWEYTSEGNISYQDKSSNGESVSSSYKVRLTYTSENNPFITNGTGLALYAAFGYVAGMPEYLIAQNLIAKIESESNSISHNPPPGSTTNEIDKSDISYTKDINGLLTSQVMNYKYESFYNNVKMSSSEDIYTYKFTCFRK